MTGGWTGFGGSYRRWLYALIVVLTIIGVLFLSGWIFTLMQTASTVIALYFFAWLLQFFFTPAVDFLERRHLSRVLAVSCVYLALGLGVSIFLYATIPGLIVQGQRLTAQLADPHTYAGISTLTRDIETFVEQRFHVPHSQIQQFTENYSVRLQKGAVTAGSQLQKLINSRLTPGNIGVSANAVLGFLNAVNTLLLDLLIVLILAFYMMLDGHKLVRQVLAYFPPEADEVMEQIHMIINRKFGGYLRSQFILALTYGLLTYIISAGFDLRYSILIAAIAAIAMLVPFIGAFVAVAPPLIGFVLVHISDPAFPFLHFILLFAFLAVAQHVVLNLMAPRVMGSALGMHPLLVMLGLLIGGELAGLWGAIFGVPVLGVLLDIADLFYRRVREPRHVTHPRFGRHVPSEPAHRPVRTRH